MKFKLIQKMHDVCRNDRNKVSENVTEEFSWKLQWTQNLLRIAMYDIHYIWLMLENLNTLVFEGSFASRLTKKNNFSSLTFFFVMPD